MQNTTAKTGKTTPGSRSDRLYLALLENFPPRPISSEEQLEATQEVIDSLISRPQLTPDLMKLFLMQLFAKLKS